MTYKPQELTEVEMPKPGTQTKGIVKEITEGKLKDFVSADALANWQNANPEEECIQVRVTTDNGTERKKVIKTPTNNSVHPSSNLAKWKKNYGEYPTVGQQVYLIANGDGFFDFVL